MDQKNAYKKLKPNRRGTFLSDSAKVDLWFQKPQKNDPLLKEYDHLPVSNVIFSGEDWLFLEKRFAFRNIDDLIKYHRESHKLYSQINSPDSALTERNSMTEEIQTIEPERR